MISYTRNMHVSSYRRMYKERRYMICIVRVLRVCAKKYIFVQYYTYYRPRRYISERFNTRTEGTWSRAWKNCQQHANNNESSYNNNNEIILLYATSTYIYEYILTYTCHCIHKYTDTIMFTQKIDLIIYCIMHHIKVAIRRIHKIFITYLYNMYTYFYRQKKRQHS